MSDQAGDVVNITVSVDDTEDAVLFVGDEEDDNYAVQARLEDDGDGKIVAQFNTYTAGDPSATVITSQHDAFDRDDLADDDMLEPGSYSMNVTSGTPPDYGSADAVGTLRLTERSTESIDIWTAPASTDITGDEVSVYQRIGGELDPVIRYR